MCRDIYIRETKIKKVFLGVFIIKILYMIILYISPPPYIYIQQIYQSSNIFKITKYNELI